MKLTSELRKLQENGDKEKERNSQLEIQVNKLKEKLSSNDGLLSDEIKVEVLKQKLKQLEGQLETVEGSYNKKISELMKEQGER